MAGFGVDVAQFQPDHHRRDAGIGTDDAALAIGFDVEGLGRCGCGFLTKGKARRLLRGRDGRLALGGIAGPAKGLDAADDGANAVVGLVLPYWGGRRGRVGGGCRDITGHRGFRRGVSWRRSGGDGGMKPAIGRGFCPYACGC